MSTPRSLSASSGITGGIVALLALLACLIAVNFLAGGLRWRRDLTEEKLYTLSDGTRNILADLPRPVELNFYFSKSLANVPTPIKTYARRVEDLLHEYSLAGGARLTVEVIDPRPDTEAEEWAIRHGIEGHPIDQYGSRLFLGLTAVSGDERAAMPMLDPSAEETLEYDITRMILRVARTAKPRIGVISRLPVMGQASPGFQMPGARSPTPSQPWAAFRELQRDFDVRRIETPVDRIDPDLQALLLVHPPEMDDQSLLAVDQYLLGGGSLLVFLDPLSITEMEQQDDPPSPYGTPPSSASSLTPLTAAWGVAWDPDALVVDIDAATRVQGQNRQIEENPLLLSLLPGAFDPEDIVTAALERMLLPLAGAVSIDPIDSLRYDHLIQSSPNAMLTDGMTARFGIQQLLRRFSPAGEPFTVAVRISGSFPTAFPDGIDVAAEADAGDPDLESDAMTDDPTTTVPTQVLQPELRESVHPGIVVLVGDVDFLSDGFAVRRIPFFGTEVMQPINDNIVFLLNAVEQVSGGIDLLAIRSRGRSSRPFTRVQELEQAARRRWVDEEQRLQQQLQETERRLNALRAEADESQGVFLTDEQQREIQRFRDEQSRTQAALREVRKNLREDIERLGLRIKLINMGLVPLLVILAGIIIALARHLTVARSKS